MDVKIEEQPIELLVEHARIPIAFTVERILSVSLPESGFAGIHMQEMDVESAWIRDHDANQRRGSNTLAEAVRHLTLGADRCEPCG